MFINFIIVISMIQIGLRKVVFNIFDELIQNNDKKISKSKMYFLVSYVFTIYIAGTILFFYEMHYVYISMSIILSNQFTIATTVFSPLAKDPESIYDFITLIKPAILLLVMILQIGYVITPLMRRMKQLTKPRK